MMAPGDTVGSALAPVRARYDLRYLPPSAFKALMAMAQVLVLREEPLIAPAEVAVRVDRYLADFRAHRKWLIRLALIGLAYWPLATLRPPFHMMSAARPGCDLRRPPARACRTAMTYGLPGRTRAQYQTTERRRVVINQ